MTWLYVYRPWYTMKHLAVLLFKEVDNQMEKKPNLNSSEKQCNPNARFLQLFMANQKSIYAFILALVRNCHDADDVMQETVTLMWDRFDEFEAGTNFGAWGTQIARFKILKHYNRRQKQASRFGDELLDKIADCASNKLDHMDDRMSALQSCVNKLSERDRRLIRIRYEQNLTMKDIADHVDRPVGGIYKAMARIHDALHRCVRLNLLQYEVK